MSAQSNRSEENIDLPTATQKFELSNELEYCSPHLMALKSPTLDKLEKMQREAQVKLQENRNKAEKKQ